LADLLRSLMHSSLGAQRTVHRVEFDGAFLHPCLELLLGKAHLFLSYLEISDIDERQYHTGNAVIAGSVRQQPSEKVAAATTFHFSFDERQLLQHPGRVGQQGPGSTVDAREISDHYILETRAGHFSPGQTVGANPDSNAGDGMGYNSQGEPLAFIDRTLAEVAGANEDLACRG
jgi:hypothetical protein